MQPSPLDLFNQVPVTLDDVETWLDAVPRIPRGSWRRAYYARCWNVPEKIARAKLAGEWPAIEARAAAWRACFTFSLWP